MCKLKVGDKVLLSNGEYGIIQSVKVEELSCPETTYNLEVEDFHTYYVKEELKETAKEYGLMYRIKDKLKISLEVIISQDLFSI